MLETEREVYMLIALTQCSLYLYIIYIFIPLWLKQLYPNLSHQFKANSYYRAVHETKIDSPLLISTKYS